MGYNEDESSDETASDETASEDTSSQETSSEETSSEETSSEDTSSEETSSEDTSSEDTSSEDTSSEDTSSEDTSSEDTSSEDTSSEDASWLASDETSTEEHAASGDGGTAIDTSLGEIFPEVKEGLELSTKPISTAWGNLTFKAKAQIKITLRHAESGKDAEGRTQAKLGLDQSQLKLELSNRLEGDFGAAKSVDAKFAPVTADMKKDKLKLATGTIEVGFSNGSKAAFELSGAVLTWSGGNVKADAGVVAAKLEHELPLGDRALGDGWTATLSATIQIQVELAPNYARIFRAAGGASAMFLIVGVATSLLVGIATVAHFVKLWQTLKDYDRVVQQFNDYLEAFQEGFAKGLDDATSESASGTEVEYEDADCGAAWKSGYNAADQVCKRALEKFLADPDVAASAKDDPDADLDAQFRGLVTAQRADLIAAARSAVRPNLKRSIYERFRSNMSGTGSSPRNLRDDVFRSLYVPKSRYHYRTPEVDRALYQLAMADNSLYRSPEVFPIPDYDTPAAEAERRYLAIKAKLDNS